MGTPGGWRLTATLLLKEIKMAKQIDTVQAQPRKLAGKGSARADRRAARIPAVIYGGKEKPVMISLEERTFTPFVQKAGFFNHLMNIETEGKSVRVLPRGVQY